MADTILADKVEQKVDTPVIVETPVVVAKPEDKLFPEKKPEDTIKPEDKDAKAVDDKAKEDKAKEDAAKLKADEDAAAAKKVADEAAAKAAKEYTLKAPDGVELAPESITQFTTVAKEMALSGEQAQKIVDWYAKQSQEKGNEQVKVWEATNAKWVEQAKTDKEFGGDKFDTSIASAKLAIKKFGTPELNEALNTSGIGNHPEMVRLFVRIAKAFGEDKMVDGKVGGGDVVDVAKKLFPNQA